ncbi:hypothetical protein ACN47E_007966 [Coniothyrium glycines]
MVVFLTLFLSPFTTVSGEQKTLLKVQEAEAVQAAGDRLAIHSPPHLSSPALYDASRTVPLAPPFTRTPSYTTAETSIIHDLHVALSTLQEQYFEIWLGRWTTAIDWTGAVMGTYLSATMSSLSRSIDYTMPGTFDKSRRLDVEAQLVENEINKYFTQLISYYFGEDYFAIRMQAFDDILWVVLGWLEATQFIEGHSSSHYTASESDDGAWHARQYIPAFAHRARIFYELAEQGWDWRLCGGGMTWNPRLLPYKNAITNELFISASISMYLHFPGDSNCSPFLSQLHSPNDKLRDLYSSCKDSTRGRYDPHFLANAINGYNWLQSSGMLNTQGLYIDGFHISGHRQNHSRTTCDERNDMVYTYNQGVLLSGLRGLWEATGNITYLEDGHELVSNVLRATGWRAAKPSLWAGLGRHGVLTELCDETGRCNQDGQTFKGIFFHHLTAFCAPLPLTAVRRGKTHAASRETASLHRKSCVEYAKWVVHNAQAALRTRDAQGRFGGWWGAPLSSSPSSASALLQTAQDELAEAAVDYRDHYTGGDGVYEEKKVAGRKRYVSDSDEAVDEQGDLNDRGRGRTVETQGSGLAVVRAMWEFVRWAEGGHEASDNDV